MTENLDENLLRRYLLGALAEADQIQLENRVFAEPEALAMLEAAELDLIDEYVTGQLNADERGRFEQMFFNSAARREKIAFAESFASVAGSRQQTADSKQQAADSRQQAAGIGQQAAGSSQQAGSEVITVKSGPVVKDGSQKSLDNRPTRRSWWRAWFDFPLATPAAFAVAVLLVAMLGVWFLLWRSPTPTEIAQETPNANRSQGAETPAPSPTPQITTPQPVSTATPAVREPANTNKTPRDQRATGKTIVGRDKSDVDKPQLPTPKPTPTPPAKKPVAPNAPAPAAPIWATLVFPLGVVRDTNAPPLRLRLPADAVQARLVFNLAPGDEFPAYQVELTTQAGAPVLRKRLTRRNLTVTLRTAAVRLPDGVYTATLTGLRADGTPTPLGYYDFAVSRAANQPQ